MLELELELDFGSEACGEEEVEEEEEEDGAEGDEACVGEWAGGWGVWSCLPLVIDGRTWVRKWWASMTSWTDIWKWMWVCEIGRVPFAELEGFRLV